MTIISDPRLAVIICSYNYEKFVGRAIESVLNQTESRCELIIVDDGSSDASWSIIESYHVTKSFKLLNGGQARAAQFAAGQTTAPFILFLDSDDELAPGSLSRIIDNLDPSVSKLQFALTPIDVDNCVLGPPAPPLQSYRRRRELIGEIAQTGIYVSPPTSGNVLSRGLCDLLSEIDYENSIDGVTLLAAPFFGDVISISAPLGFYRLHSRGLSMTSVEPTPSKLRRDVDLFIRRLVHLERIVASAGADFEITNKRTFFFVAERTFYAAILDNRRPPLSDAIAVLKALKRERKSTSHKLALCLLVIACGLAPNAIASSLIAYRLRPIKRTWIGALKAFLNTKQRMERPQAAIPSVKFY